MAHNQHQQESPKPFSEIPGNRLLICVYSFNIFVLLYVGNSGWPIIGAIELLTKIGNGKVGKESFFHEVRAKYGPIAKFKTPG